LDCEYNNRLEQLPELPDNIVYLNLGVTGIKTLPKLPSKLRELICDMGCLKELPALPDTLISLKCKGNLLSELPKLPETLIFLQCSYNRLERLPPLPSKLEVLFCEKNQLKQLPELPLSLAKLYVADNQLSVLPNVSHIITNFVDKEYFFNPESRMIPFMLYGNPVIETYGLDISVLLSLKSYEAIAKQIGMVNRFREIYYCIMFKGAFRKWLWEKVRLPKVSSATHPDLLGQLLEDEDMDDDEFQHTIDTFGYMVT
jgi:Leucine-rich repeat (LRR) protein